MHHSRVLLHCLVNAVFTAVGIPADGSGRAAPARNLQISWTLSQSPRVRLYASITSITSAIPSFSFPPITADRMGAVMSVLSRGRYASRSAAPSALISRRPPRLALVACAWISRSRRLFFPWVEFLPSHPGNRLKFRSPGKAPNDLGGVPAARSRASPRHHVGVRHQPPVLFHADGFVHHVALADGHAAFATSSNRRSSSPRAAYGR